MITTPMAWRSRCLHLSSINTYCFTPSLISPHSRNCVPTVLNYRLHVQALEEDKIPGYTSFGTGQAVGVGKHRISHYHQQSGPKVLRSGKNVWLEILIKMKRQQVIMTNIPEISRRQSTCAVMPLFLPDKTLTPDES